MMAAEQWYEYQDNYKRYGLDMKPRAQRKKQVRAKKSAALFTSKDKFRLILFTFFVGILCVGLIVTTAYAASVKIQTNTMIKENAVLLGEIENLKVELEKGANIQVVEYRAMTELGMVYPSSQELIYIQTDKVASTDFILAMKEQAYN